MQPNMLTSVKPHEEPPPQQPNHHHLTTTTLHLLLSCAELINRSDLTSAHRFLSSLTATSSPLGDSSDRLTYQFTQALSLRLANLSRLPSALPPPPPLDRETLQSAYLSLNQITPFIRFGHLTANQAILEAFDSHRSLHIIDFDTMYGLQWPPLMQAIADRSDPTNPPFLRITGTGLDLDVLHRTGDRLKTFADSLGLRFRFDPTTSYDRKLDLHDSELLVVNCVHFMHKMPRNCGSTEELKAFLRSVKSMRPAVVTVAEREAGHNNPNFLHRFKEALDYYAVVFESLESTVSPNSPERASVEQVWFGREIADIIGGEDEGRIERHERFEEWEKVMNSVGFVAVPLSPFALSQAKLLLRLHYPCEGYQLQMVKDSSLFLGWKSRALFSVSSWR